ncbi:unnamed protein product [Closterium sp. NIES-65]|nr:unnamed protein product [Closterium sp. NIES-65]
MGDQWHTAKDDLQWMHGPRVNATRIRAYILSIARQEGIAKAEELEELNPDVRVQPLRATTVSMLLMCIKALQTACKVEGTLFGVKELHIMYDISEVRSEVRAMVREKWHRDDRDCVDRHRRTLGDTYTTDQIRHLMFKHLFHVQNDKAQKELLASSHSRITKEMWRTNKIFITRNTHAARAGGAQELADDGVPRSDIADLGHWALEKLAKSYITTIPKAAVLRKAGYTGKCGDYHLDRSLVTPDPKVVALIAQHIFPWAEAELDKAVRCTTAREPNTAGVHFLQSLIEFGRRIVAEDLAGMLMREPWHPYVHSSKLCRDPDFQKWAKDVNRVDLETIATRGTPTENPQEVDQLTMMLHHQREDAAIEKLGMQKQLEEKDAEIARLMQALKLAEARPTAPAPPTTRSMTAAKKAAAVKIENKQDNDLTYEVNVVHPWRTSKTVKAAWRWWNNPSNFDSRPLRERYEEHRFLVRHTRMICKVEKGDKPAASAKSAKSSRGRQPPTDGCPTTESDDAADTAAVIKLLDHLGRAGLSTFSDALLVLRATPPIKAPTTADGKSVAIKGLDKPLARKLAVAWGMVTAGYMDAEWGKRLFGDLWEEQAKKAGFEAEATAGATGAGKRKRAG